MNSANSKGNTHKKKGPSGLIVLFIITCLVVIITAVCLYLFMFTDFFKAKPAISKENPYSVTFNAYNDYIIENSSSSYLSKGDISNLSDKEFILAKNEIYARHGQIFEDSDLQEYFSARSWYSNTSADQNYNDFEKENLFLFENYEKEKSGALLNQNNPYLKYLSKPDQYFFENSNTGYLTGEDLADLSIEKLCIIRNEIFARKGYIFKDENLKSLFYCTNWYKPSVLGESFSEEVFNEYEKDNISLIKLYEQIKEGVEFSSDNPYKEINDKKFIFSESSTKELYDDKIAKLDINELTIARNEIFARHGYVFKDKFLLEYFLSCDWYRPSAPLDKEVEAELNETEKKNIKRLKEYQELLEKIEGFDTSLTYTYKNDYISLKLPKYFKEHCVIENDSFHEKYNYEESGGFLFSFMCLEEDEEIYYPSYDILGTLTHSSGKKYTLIAIFPTDVQFEPFYHVIYNKMRNEFNRITKTIKGNNEYTFTK